MSDQQEAPAARDVDAFTQLRRYSQRWAAANGKHVKKRMRIPDEKRAEELVRLHGPDRVLRVAGKLWDTVTGECLEKRVYRKTGPFVRGKVGFLTVNDGVSFAEQMSAAVDGRAYRPLGDGSRSGVVEQHEHAQMQLLKRQLAQAAYRYALGLSPD